MNLNKPGSDIIYHNGKILTVDGAFSTVEAVSISGDRVLSTGKNEEVLRSADENTVLVDLEGRTVIPGIIDSHAHPTWAALSELSGEIPIIRSLDDLFDWIKKEVFNRPPGEWIVHPLFFISRLMEQSYPSLTELDALTPEHPVFLNGTHSGMVNTKALDVSGLLSNMYHPGVLLIPGTNKPTGIIRTEIFPLLSYKAESKPDEQGYAAALESLLHRYNSVGITGVTDGMVGVPEMDVLQRLKREKRLTVRVNVCVIPNFKEESLSADDVLSELESSASGSVVALEAVKIFLDGGILTGTAAMREPWGKRAQRLFGFQEDDFRGVLHYTQEQLTEIALAVVKRGRKFTAHCTGDRGLDMLLTAFEAANTIRKIADLRWSVIHGNFVDSQTIDRIKRLGIVLECQIAWFYKDAPYIENILGSKYLKKFLPLRTMIDRGIILAGGSDHMVKNDSLTSINSYNHFLSIGTMVTRKTESGRIMAVEESISRESALRMYTINGAYSTGEEAEKGSIEPGKLADMVILDSDYLECDANEISNIKVETTILGASVVYERAISE